MQNAHSQNVLTQETLNALPTGRTVQAFAALTLGARGTGASAYDVGGNTGETPLAIVIHGSRGDDNKRMIDGMNYNHSANSGGGANRLFLLNQLAMQETTLTTGSSIAEWETAGVNINAVPRDGGNTFRGNSLVN